MQSNDEIINETSDIAFVMKSQLCQLIISVVGSSLSSRQVVTLVCASLAMVSGLTKTDIKVRHFLRKGPRLAIDLEILGGNAEMSVRTIGEHISLETSPLHSLKELKNIFSGSIFHVLAQQNPAEHESRIAVPGSSTNRTAESEVCNASPNHEQNSGNSRTPYPLTSREVPDKCDPNNGQIQSVSNRHLPSYETSRSSHLEIFQCDTISVSNLTKNLTENIYTVPMHYSQALSVQIFSGHLQGTTIIRPLTNLIQASLRGVTLLSETLPSRGAENLPVKLPRQLRISSGLSAIIPEVSKTEVSAMTEPPVFDADFSPFVPAVLLEELPEVVVENVTLNYENNSPAVSYDGAEVVNDKDASTARKKVEGTDADQISDSDEPAAQSYVIRKKAKNLWDDDD